MPRRRSTPTPTGSLPSVPVRVAGASFLAQTLNRPYDNPKDHSSFNVAREISPKLCPIIMKNFTPPFGSRAQITANFR